MKETLGTLHLKSRQRRREIYFPKYIYIFVLSIEKRLGMNCPNLGKIIVRRWSDNFTRLSEVLHEVVQMWEHTFFFKDADYRDIRGKYNSRQWLDKGLSIYYVSTFWGVWCCKHMVSICFNPLNIHIDDIIYERP